MSAYARVRAVSAVSLGSLQAESALLVQDDGSATELDARLLQYGDRLKILAHTRIVTDGKVLKGESAVDESMVTGESIPVRKQSGDNIIAGTINGPGLLEVKLSRLPGENSIAEVSQLVQNAIGAKPQVQDLADKVASYFIPAIVAVSLMVFAIWVAIVLKVQHGDGSGAAGIAITYAIAVLAVSCPCALGLAVPMVLVIACGVGARLGVIIKAADVVEKCSKATDIVFDKTGTLTNGDLEVAHEQIFPDSFSEDEILGVAKALVEGNEHPVSAALASFLAQRTSADTRLDDMSSIPGAGIQGHWRGLSAKAGNPFWLGLEEHLTMVPLLQKGMTYLCLTVDRKLVAVWGLQSTLRQEAAAIVAELQQSQITCHIVSGDAPKAVEEVALFLGIETSNTLSRRSPAEKQQYVKDLQASGKNVIFCGDGTNDAIAVAQADVGIQIGSASDVTSAVADVVLLGGLDGVMTLLELSRRAYRRILFNFVWTFIYNTFAILLAAGAFVKVRIPPAYAGLGEIVSIAPVILVAASLVWLRKRKLN
jgi:Cu2+-exporting ATPase